MKNPIEKFLRCLTAPAEQQHTTKRQRQVAALIAAGFTNQEVADNLAISIKTVQKHREQLHRRLGLRNTADLTRWALARGLLKNEY